MDKAVREGAEPVSLSLAKAHCRIDTTDEDDLLNTVYIPAGRQTVEQYTGLVLLSQPMQCVAPSMPDGMGIVLPVLPASDLTKLEALASDGTATELDIAGYGATILNGNTCAFVVTGKALPGDACLFRVSFTAGYADGTVPPNLMLAMLDFVGDAYENREAQQAGAVLQRNPRAVALMDPFRTTFGL